MKTTTTLIFSFLSLTILNSQSWIRQNPFPQLSVIQDIHFDGLTGIAVGDESTILTTTNGGVNWIPRKAPQAGSFFQTALVVPGSNGQLMLAGGYQLMISRDGGVTWNYTSAPTQLVYKIQSLPDGKLLVLDSDQGFTSNDDGENWDAFPLPGPNTSAGHFTNEMNGWVVFGGFDNNQVWVTTDGGESWEVRDPLKHPVVSEVFMMDEQNGYLGSRDYVYKTNDGGDTWIKMHDNPVNSIRDMHVVNENEIWTCLNNGFIFYTLDGGNQWTEINPNIINNNQTIGLFANDEGKVWVGGKFVSIMYSSDFGEDWTDQVPNAKGIMYEPHFINENIGIVGSSEGVVLKSNNGGASFEKLQFGPDENFLAVEMIDEQAMVVASSSGKVFGSQDQGENWSLLGENLGQVSDIHAFNLQSAVLSNQFGQIFKTTDGGTQWDEVYSGNTGLLFGMDFVDSQKGWACGWNGQILKTENGGATWTSQYYNGYSQFADIHFTSDIEGWVVTSNFSDTIWHTTNGGNDWQPSVLPNKTFWHKVSFSNPDTGWIAGGGAGYGIIMRTNNGGQSWTMDHQAPEAFFGLYAIPGKETVWATGAGGNIEKYSPCTFNLSLSNLTGEEMPCQFDTVMYAVTSSDVDIFEWTYPADWLVYGNPNTSSIQMLVGSMPGTVSVIGKDGCNNTTPPLSLDVNPIGVPQAMITENEGILTCNLNSGFYQWLRDGVPIPGADQKTYTPVSSGHYEVVVEMFATGCQTRSNGIDVLINGVSKESIEEKFIIFPNPSDGDFYIRLDGVNNNPANGMLSVFDVDGRVKVSNVKFAGQFQLEDLPKGIYIALIQVDGKLYPRKITVQ